MLPDHHGNEKGAHSRWSFFVKHLIILMGGGDTPFAASEINSEFIWVHPGKVDPRILYSHFSRPYREMDDPVGPPYFFFSHVGFRIISGNFCGDTN